MKNRNIIGIDVGGTKIKAILWNGEKVTGAFKSKTPKTKKEFIKILNFISKNFSRNNQRINGVAVGAAGIIKGTEIVFSPNILYLKNFDFRIIFKPPLKLRTDNDARSFLRGEIIAGVGKIRGKKIIGFTLGTGIGRAYAEKNKVKKIKKFEYPEKWEKEYQKIRDRKNDAVLSAYLAEKLSIIIKKYKPDLIIFGGGLIQKKNFFAKIKKELSAAGVKTSIKKSINAGLSPALGAAFLFE